MTCQKAISSATTAVALVIGVLIALPGAAEGDCGNASLRIGTPSSELPDCRGYEMVSPLEKGPASDVAASAWSPSVSATDGNKVAYETVLPLPNAVSAPVVLQNVATRGETSWSSVPIGAPMGNILTVQGISDIFENTCAGWTADLAECVLRTHSALTPDATASPYISNLYLDELDRKVYELLTPFSEASTSAQVAQTLDVEIRRDTREVVFEGSGYTKDTPRGPDVVYAWKAGTIDVLNVLPERFGGQVTPYATLGQGGVGPYSRNAVSADGSRVIFTFASQIWMREDGTQTRWISESQRHEPEAMQETRYLGATADGSKVLFSSVARLTDDATGRGDLYEYETASGLLTDLTVDHNSNDPNGAGFLGMVEYSDDGRYIYFAARGQMVPGEGASGQPNLYVIHDGQIEYVATLASTDQNTWSDNAGQEGQARGERGFIVPWAAISANGQWLAIMSRARLTTDDNAGNREVYLYNSEDHSLACVSCNPNGLPSTSDASFGLGRLYSATSTSHQPTNLSSDGSRLFFDTADALNPTRDTNGEEDVYEWERNGQDGCTRSPGCVYLISGGKGYGESLFAAASASGSDAFFMTRDHLVAEDSDTRVDLYDARVGGGFPQAPPPAAPCVDEGCRPAPSPPPEQLPPGTITFEGPGDVAKAEGQLTHKKPRAIKRKAKHRVKHGKRRPAHKHGRHK